MLASTTEHPDTVDKGTSSTEQTKQRRRSKIYEIGLGVLIWLSVWVPALVGLYALSRLSGD
jgi:hypothetical protein